MQQMKYFLTIFGLTLISTNVVGCGPSSDGNIVVPGAGGGGIGVGGNGVGSISNQGGGLGTGIPLGTGGGTTNPACDGPNPPKNCPANAPPGCGDGKKNQDSEDCDDGNTLAGDGCNGICKIEPNHACPTPGQPCVVTFTCGDGVVNPGEACDQGSNQSKPGCSADCKTQDPGYKCVPGEACVPMFECGNSRIETGETCDPPNVGNGCGNNCKAEDGWRCKPGSCVPKPSCGDGIVQADMGEKCDQGKSQGSPGCSADCQSMDATCTCTPGKACVCQKPTCGDGIVQIGEQCDDKKSAYPGCSDTCQLESGYKCPFAGAPCVANCGDGILTPPAEQCDPAAKIPNVATACAADCSVKPGWACDSTSCRETKCGDGKIEGTEGCDPGKTNNDLGDGCTGTCTAEPTCPAGGGGCTTKCGDGLVLTGEDCDDGNAVSGDGCSATCKFEAGFTCEQPPLGETMTVPLVVRDFSGGADFEKGGDFAKDLNFANMDLLKPQLDANGLKPELAKTTGTYNGVAGKESGIASAASFAQWYNDAASGPNAYNKTLGTTLTLFRVEGSDPVTYVNRFGTNGDGLTNVQYRRTRQEFCAEVGKEDHDADGNVLPCTVCYYDSDPTTPQCETHQATVCETNKSFIQCVKDAAGKQWMGVFLEAAFDGNPLFFPADSLTPANPAAIAQISGNYDGSWPTDPSGKTRNYSFTTEVRFWFKYDSSKAFKLKFVGDDDVWVFVNKRLAVDLGGIHTAVQGELSLTNGAASVTVTNTLPLETIVNIKSSPNLGTLENGKVYEIVVFQAERQTKASSYQLSLSGFNAARSICKPVCGGSNPGVSPGEECDNGDAGNCDPASGDCYNKCTKDCNLGPRCGDGVLQSEHEQCDNGKNTDGYAAAGSNACTPNCTLPPSCGDGKVQIDYGEECDDADKNDDNLYGGCTTKCKLGPSCGDGVKNGNDEHPESCDDGINDGTYATCSPGCTPPPRCGDGTVQDTWGEQCEPTASDDPNCTADCRLPGYCGDGVVDKNAGEQCDYGKAKNIGDYGGCNSNCTMAPFCGDGIANGPEKCDFGAALNTNEYGGCAPTCQLGPHCGDGFTNGLEQCDDGSGADGNGTANSDCTPACKFYIQF